MFTQLLKSHGLNTNEVKWANDNIKVDNKILTFLYKKGFAGSFAFSFQQNMLQYIREQKKSELKDFLSKNSSYFPEFKKIENKEDRDRAVKYVKYELLTFDLMLKDPLLSFKEAWDLVAYKLESDVVKRLLFKPYSVTTIIKRNNITYIYDVRKLAKNIKEDSILKRHYSLEMQLMK